METIYSLISNIDPTVLKILIAVAVVVLIVSILKKAIKLAIIVVVLGLVITWAMPIVEDFKEANLGISDSGITLTLNDNEIVINKDSLKNNKIQALDYDGQYYIVFNETKCEVPETVYKVVDTFIDKNGDE